MKAMTVLALLAALGVWTATAQTAPMPAQTMPPAAAPAETAIITPIGEIKRSATGALTIQGKIVEVVDKTKLRLADDSGRVLVDAGVRGALPAGFTPEIGARVTVTGKAPAGKDFEADSIRTQAGETFTITRTNAAARGY